MYIYIYTYVYVHILCVYRFIYIYMCTYVICAIQEASSLEMADLRVPICGAANLSNEWRAEAQNFVGVVTLLDLSCRWKQHGLEVVSGVTSSLDHQEL